jgi:hypothetical protein
MYIDSWYVRATCGDGFIWNSYGLTAEVAEKKARSCYAELAGSFRGGWDHDEALKDAGYES